MRSYIIAICINVLLSILSMISIRDDSRCDYNIIIGKGAKINLIFLNIVGIILLLLLNTITYITSAYYYSYRFNFLAVTILGIYAILGLIWPVIGTLTLFAGTLCMYNGIVNIMYGLSYFMIDLTLINIFQ